MPNAEKTLTRKELAAAAGYSAWYITRAKIAGFVMPGRKATLTEFREWLRGNPDFIAKNARKKAPPPCALAGLLLPPDASA